MQALKHFQNVFNDILVYLSVDRRRVFQPTYFVKKSYTGLNWTPIDLNTAKGIYQNQFDCKIGQFRFVILAGLIISYGYIYI